MLLVIVDRPLKWDGGARGGNGCKERQENTAEGLDGFLELGVGFGSGFSLRPHSKWAAVLTIRHRTTDGTSGI